MTADRVAGSTAWLPRYSDSSAIRFTSQENALDIPCALGRDADRLSAICSDPGDLFHPHSFYREPDWMKPPRGPDGFTALSWFPVVTGLQLLPHGVGDDLAMGYGHVYAPEHYITLDGRLPIRKVLRAEDIAR